MSEGLDVKWRAARANICAQVQKTTERWNKPNKINIYHTRPLWNRRRRSDCRQYTATRLFAASLAPIPTAKKSLRCMCMCVCRYAHVRVYAGNLFNSSERNSEERNERPQHEWQQHTLPQSCKAAIAVHVCVNMVKQPTICWACE